MKKLLQSIIIAVLALFTSCNSIKENNSKPLVVCTTNIIGDALHVLLEQDATVVSLMGAGVDPHLYKASQKDLEYLQDADIIVSNGLHLEGKMADVLLKLAKRKKVIIMSDGVDPHSLIEVSENVHDPHIWFDVRLWGEAISYLSSELQTALPEFETNIEERYELYREVLINLDKQVLSSIAEIPDSQQVLITAHDAFGYFGRAYSIEVMGLQGISTQSEYGLKDISNLVQFIHERNVKAVFVETSVNDKPLLAVQEGTKKLGHDLKIGGSLYSDALGGKEESGNNYVNMVTHNVNTIVNALK